MSSKKNFLGGKKMDWDLIYRTGERAWEEHKQHFAIWEEHKRHFTLREHSQIKNDVSFSLPLVEQLERSDAETKKQVITIIKRLLNGGKNKIVAMSDYWRAVQIKPLTLFVHTDSNNNIVFLSYAFNLC